MTVIRLMNYLRKRLFSIVAFFSIVVIHQWYKLGQHTISNQKSKPTRSKDDFRVSTWNIRVPFPSDVEKKLSWRDRQSSVAAAIASSRPDIIALQEDCFFMSNSLMNSDTEIGKLSDTYERYGLFNRNGESRPSGSWPENVFTQDGMKDGEHNSVWYDKSRFVSLRNVTFWLSRTPEKVGSSFDEITGRIVNCVLLNDKLCVGRNDRVCPYHLLFCSTHFPSGNETKQLWSAHVLSEMFSQIHDDHSLSHNKTIGLEMMVSGDFNSIPGSKTHQLMIDLGFVDARSISMERSVMDHYSNTTNDWYNDNNDSLIDYVWLYNGLSRHVEGHSFNVKSVKHIPVICCTSEFPSTNNEAPIKTASDHVMVVVDFSFQYK